MKKTFLTLFCGVFLLFTLAPALPVVGERVEFLEVGENQGAIIITIKGVDYDKLVIYPLPKVSATLMEIQGQVEDGNTVFVVPGDLDPRLVWFNFRKGENWSLVDGSADNIRDEWPIGVLGVFLNSSKESPDQISYYFRQPGQAKKRSERIETW